MSNHFVIGKVDVVGNGLLEILAEGKRIFTPQIWISPSLLIGFDPQLSGELTGAGSCSVPDGDGGSTSVTVDVTTTVTSGQLVSAFCSLSVGDRVMMLTRDGQEFYLLGKAVRYG